MRKTDNDFIFERETTEGLEYVVFLRLGIEQERKESYHPSEWDEFRFNTEDEADSFIRGIDLALCWMGCKIRDSLYEDCDDQIYGAWFRANKPLLDTTDTTAEPSLKELNV